MRPASRRTDRVATPILVGRRSRGVNAGHLFLDPRIGSGHLAEPLANLGVDVRVTRMRFGDAALVGHGPRGYLDVGFELKKVPDLLRCISDGRFSGHQLPGLLEQYEVVYLIVQGRYRRGPDGALWVGKKPYRLGGRTWRHSAVAHFLATMRNRVGLTVVYTSDHSQTVSWLAEEASWWAAPWASHTAHLAMSLDVMKRPKRGPLGTRIEEVDVRPASVFRERAAMLPGVRWHRSGSFEERFHGREEELMAASLEDLAAVETGGKRLGLKTARRIWRELHA